MGKLTRRAFLISGATIGTGLVVGVGYLSTVDTDGLSGVERPDGRVALNAWVTIAADGAIEFAVPRTEMGQGVFTSLPMLIAEELEVELSAKNVTVVHPTDELPVYTNYAIALDTRPEEMTGPINWVGKKVVSLFPFIATGGSTSIVAAWHPLRVAGASARLMLIEAAAAAWQVSAVECQAKNGKVIHEITHRSLTYGELAAKAVNVAPTPHPRLKTHDGFTLIGTNQPRLDLREKTDGTATFGIDVQLPDMLYAAVRQCPVCGGKVKSMDEDSVKTPESGVVQVVDLGDAVGVIAKSYWQAQKAADRLAVEFDEGEHAALESKAMLTHMRALLQEGEAHVFRDKGDVEGVANGTSVAATYQTPFLAHACMEPMNCTAKLHDDGSLELWTGTQSPLLARWGAAKGADIAGDIKVNVTLAGGGFGRRVEGDIAKQAAALAAAVPGRAVKLIWSREEDIQHDAYRPHALSDFRAQLGPNGKPMAWVNRVVTQSVDVGFGGRNTPVGGDDGSKDPASVEGAVELPYEIPNVRVELVDHPSPIPVGFWRSVGHSNNAFFTECFLDECAAKATLDPLTYRLELLGAQPEFRAVLSLLAEHSQWAVPLGENRGRGVAIHRSFRSIVGQVAEVTATSQGISVDRVVCVIDCGTVINPDIVRAQMEGSINYGLSALFYGEISIAKGRVTQSNFHNYPMLRHAQSPTVETHIVPSTAPPGGVGEPGLPPVMPAVVNAIFAATGRRYRQLPLASQGVKLV